MDTSSETPKIPPFTVIRIAHVPPQPPTARWLVEDLWAEGAVGVLGGTPKTGKTWLALELAIAVASGRPCLGRYPVPNPGPVLIYAAEDTASALRERALAIAQVRGIRQIERLAVGLITEPELRLDLPGHQLRLDVTLETIKPRLLILDPLVRLHAANENSSTEVSALLGFLRALQRAHGVAIALVHHVRKSAAGQPGQSLRGSGDLHAWGDSNLFLIRRDGQLQLHVEHRSHPAPRPMAISLAQDPPHLDLGAAVEPDELSDLDQAVLKALGDQAPTTRSALRDRLRVRNERLGEVLERLEAAGRVRRTDAGWTVPRSHA